MNEVVNSGVMNIASLVVSVVVLLIGLILWFFINRASSRTNEQIELLEALLDQQKRQNALLRRLCEANEPEKADKKTVESQKSVEDEDIIRLVAELTGCRSSRYQPPALQIPDVPFPRRSGRLHQPAAPSNRL